MNDVGSHADFLEKTRHTAAVYVSEIRPLFPETVQEHLQVAVDSYDDEIDPIRDLRELCATQGPDLETHLEPDLEIAAEILSRVLAHERAALAAIQRALDES